MPLFASCANLAQILCAFVKKWQDDIQSEFCTTGAWSVMWILPKLCHTDDAYYQGFPVSDFTYFEIQIQQNWPTLNPLKGAFIVKLNKSTNTHSRIKNTSRDQTSSDFKWVQSIDWTNYKAEVFNSWNWWEIFSAELKYLVPRKTGTIWPLWLLHFFTHRKSSTEQQQPSFADLKCYVPKHTHTLTLTGLKLCPSNSLREAECGAVNVEG